MKSITIILSVLLLYACADVRSSEKYQLVASQDGNVYRLDKTSGEVWLIKGKTMQKVQAELSGYDPLNILGGKTPNPVAPDVFQPIPGESYGDYLKRARAAGIITREQFEAAQKKYRESNK